MRKLKVALIISIVLNVIFISSFFVGVRGLQVEQNKVGAGKVFIYVYSIPKSINDIKNELMKDGVEVSDDIRYSENNKIAELDFIYQQNNAEKVHKILMDEATNKTVFGAKALWGDIGSSEKPPATMLGTAVLTDVSLLKQQ